MLLICFLKWVFFADLHFYNSLSATVNIQQLYCEKMLLDVNHKGLAVLIHVYLGGLLILHLALSITKYAIPVITKQMAMLVVCQAVCKGFQLRVFYLWEIKEYGSSQQLYK